MMTRIAILLGAATLAIAVPARAETDWTPLELRLVSGLRPFVPVKLNGLPLQFMVHANASFIAMTTHANADRAEVGPLTSTGSYGIQSPGKVSALGRGTATLRSLQVGGSVVENVALSVFEVPQKPVVDGMLGIKWLRMKRAIIDFGQVRLGVPASDADAQQERARLLSLGYKPYALSWDEAKVRYTVQAEVNGVAATMVVSTVSHLVIDSVLAGKAGIKLSKPTEEYAGPRGATGQAYANTSPVRLAFNGHPAVVPQASIYDLYDYDSAQRPPAAEQVGGLLGCEFMLPNKAVIDFGNGILYLYGS